MAPNKHKSWKFLGLASLVVIVLIAAYVLSVFVDVLLVSVALAYIVFPLAKWLNKGKTERSMKWLIASLGAVLLVAVPIIFILFYSINIVLQWFILNLPSIHSGQFLAELKVGLNAIGLGIVSERAASEAGKLIAGFADSISSLVLRPTWLVETMIKVSIFFIATFYFVYEGSQIGAILKKHIPSREKFLTELVSSIDRLLYSLFVSHFFTSVIIAAFSAIGFWIFLRPSLIMLGFLVVMMFIISFLPVIGPWLMYVPIGLWEMMFMGNGIWSGIGLLVFGLIFLTVIPDFYIRPKLVQRGTELHPLLLILGFFGGPLLLGLKGVIIGPLILGLAQVIVSLYAEKRHILKELVEHF